MSEIYNNAWTYQESNGCMTRRTCARDYGSSGAALAEVLCTEMICRPFVVLAFAIKELSERRTDSFPEEAELLDASKKLVERYLRTRGACHGRFSKFLKQDSEATA